MKKTNNLSAYLFLLVAFALTSCAKQDPILPGDRVSVFADDITVTDMTVPRDILARALAGGSAPTSPAVGFRQSTDNIVYQINSDGTERKIFSGFPTTSHVSGTRHPIDHNGFVYAGLSTGEVVKIAPKSRDMRWAADIFKTSTITGGSEILDIVAPIVIDGGYVYAGGLGGAFCKLRDATGARVWCDWITVATPFSIYGDLAFVISTDGHLYTINTRNGAIYARAETKCTSMPELSADGDTYYITCTGKRPEKIKI